MKHRSYSLSRPARQTLGSTDLLQHHPAWIIASSDYSEIPLHMPVIVTTRKLTAWHHDLPDEIKVDMLNEVVEDFAIEAVSALSNLCCLKHPNETSFITIMADRKRSMIIEKKFCCSEFEQKVSLKLKR